jgi:8-oxo-dGTP pyrophosphatase MutT (NUDIX family)
MKSSTKKTKGAKRKVKPQSKIQHLKAKITYAAGGIVWRKTKKGRQVLLVFRPEYSDWTLPKGHIEADDDGWDKAAQREVKEETGYDTVITDFAGFTAYKVKGEPKVVFFWNMKPRGKANFCPSDEVTACQWFNVAEAIERLTYEKDKALLRQFANHD